MSENENIEAKLCSYIEGDLDADGRAEIEKYLVAHPQYRPVLAELSRTRVLLRQLPRASAPGELLETLSGQIERSALLGDDDRGAMQTHSSRIPQLTAWAAVLILTIGLAAVVYRVLPSNKTQPELALLKPAPSPVNSTQVAADDIKADEIKKSLPEMTQALKDEISVASVPATQSAPIAAATPIPDDRKLAMNDEKSPTSDAPAATSFAIASANTAVGGTAVSGGTTVVHGSSQPQLLGSIVAGDATQFGQNMYVTLHATDARAAGAGVTQYLSRNGFQFESRAMDDSARVSTGPLPPLTLSDKYDVSGGASTSTTTPPSGAVAYRRGVSDPIADQSGVMARKPALADETDRELGMALTPPPSSTQTPGDVIIIHNLTSDQAKQLASDLAVKVLPAQIDLLPSTQPLALDAARPLTADSPLQVGESVRIIAHDDGLPGVEAMNESQTINADGSITLPLVGKMKAAGLTREQLAQKIPDAYRDAKSPTTATWVIDRLHADVPTTDSTLALTPTAAALATGAKAPTTAPGALAFDKDQQPASGSFGGGSGGGIGGRADGAVSNRQAANNQQGIDVTIRVVGESAATQPHTQTIVQPSAPIAAPAISPATTMPTTAPVP